MEEWTSMVEEGKNFFADDCKLYGAVNDDGDNTMQIDLKSLESWSRKWQLPFNAAKCKVMHFGDFRNV